VRRSDRPSTDWWELLATILLSLATVATAWSGYQAARWSGEQSRANRAAGAHRTESTRQSNLANQQTAIDVAAFTGWLDAAASDDDGLATTYRERFRPEFALAFDDWLDRATPTNGVPAGTPFESTYYRLAATDEADRLLAEAYAAAERSDRANQNADNFVLTGVLYASVLFFAGIASKMRSFASTKLAIGLSALMFTVATLVMTTLPWNVGF
jgi:hypothetical protein